jgi:hypothetical protein
MEHNTDLIEALRMKIEALELKNEAMAIKVEALELKNLHMQLLHETQMAGNGHDENGDGEGYTGKKRGRKPKGSDSLSRMQAPMELTVRNMLSGERFNRATYRALTGILLCLYENGKANVSTLYEYIGGSRVTIVRHTALMKKLDLLRYEGSRKKGHYVLTDKGRALVSQVAEESLAVAN